MHAGQHTQCCSSLCMLLQSDQHQKGAVGDCTRAPVYLCASLYALLVQAVSVLTLEAGALVASGAPVLLQ